MLDALAPVLFLGLLALVHAAYFQFVRRRPGQQMVQVAIFPDEGQGGALRLAAASGRREASRYRRPLVLGDAFYLQPLICGSGLTINGLAVFKGPVKVAGDLVIIGEADFTQPVVVNGRVRVVGRAVFQQGLLAKSDLIVSGVAAVGSPVHGAWLVANRAKVQGDLWLNGRLETLAPGRRRAS
jgi:hypothetical protein